MIKMDVIDRKIKAALIGATGYTGVELTRLLLQHAQVDLSHATSQSACGNRLDEVFPAFRGKTDLIYHPPGNTSFADDIDVIFFATPNSMAMCQSTTFLERDIKVIDLSADFRIKDPVTWEKWYGTPHAAPDLLKQAVYGLPEINRDKIRAAQLIANPGCYPTAIILALLPLLENRLLDKAEIIADAKSGVSGAGRQATTEKLFCEISESFKPYAANHHRHLPEIIQLLRLCDQDPDITFVPHLLPIMRGIEVSLYVRLPERADNIDVNSLYNTYYQDEPFVDIMPPNAHPDTRSVRNTNLCRIAIHHSAASNRIIIFSVIDNLIKGAAGQAIQNMNLMFGLEETTGLHAIAPTP